MTEVLVMYFCYSFFDNQIIQDGVSDPILLFGIIIIPFIIMSSKAVSTTLFYIACIFDLSWLLLRRNKDSTQQ